MSNGVTNLRNGTLTRLRALEGYADCVLDSRISALSDAEIPVLVAVTQQATVEIKGEPELFGDRQQTLDLFAEFTAPTGATPAEADAALAAAADAIEVVLWGALVSDPSWMRLWHRFPKTWKSTYVCTAGTNKRRCTLHVEITGQMQMAIADADDFAVLREIRATMTDADGLGPAYEERIPIAPDPEE